MSESKNYKNYGAIRIKDSKDEPVQDALVIEESLLINVNTAPFTLTMRSPGADRELTRGILFTENILPLEADFDYQIVEKKSGITTAVNVNTNPEHSRSEFLDKRNLLSVSSCGICGKIEKNDFLDDKPALEQQFSISFDQIQSMFQIMEEKQELFKSTGGCHGVAGFSKDGSLISMFEDIGRHNAVDKVIGGGILKNKLDDLDVLLVSGRVSYEIVSKAYMAKIPVIIAVSAPSSLAVDLSEELGITLLAFFRENRISCYSNSDRISLNVR